MKLLRNSCKVAETDSFLGSTPQLVLRYAYLLLRLCCCSISDVELLSSHKAQGEDHLSSTRGYLPCLSLGCVYTAGGAVAAGCQPAGISLPCLGTENRAVTAHNMAQLSSSNISTKFRARLRAAAPPLQARVWTSSFQVVLREAGAIHCCVPSWLEPSVEEERERSFFPHAKTPGGFFQHH